MVIKTCVYEKIWIETQINLFWIFSEKKKEGNSQILILPAQTLG